MTGVKFEAGTGGCSFWANCLTCPFGKCRFDYYGEGQALRVRREETIAEMARDGYSAEQIAQVLPGAGDVGTIRAWMTA